MRSMSCNAWDMRSAVQRATTPLAKFAGFCPPDVLTDVASGEEVLLALSSDTALTLWTGYITGFSKVIRYHKYGRWSAQHFRYLSIRQAESLIRTAYNRYCVDQQKEEL